MATLNYKYRLHPTEAQANALAASMRLIRWGWNLAVRRECWARKMIVLGRAANLHRFLAEKAAAAHFTGRRAANVIRLVGELGITEEEAKLRLNAVAVERAWGRKKSGLSVDYAMASTDAAKQSMVGKRIGKAWAKLLSNKGKFFVSWKACWDGVREPPRRNKDRHSGWLAVQLQDQDPIRSAQPNAKGDNWVDLGLLMPSLAQSEADVRFEQHRPVPPEAKLVELKITRHRRQWWLVLTIQARVAKSYPETGKSCGIDPGQSTPTAIVGDDMEPGVGGLSRGPGRPLTKALKKIARLQRKLDRQRRENNPACYREDGTRINGRGLTKITKGMRETEDRIARAHAHCADIRRDVWNKVTDEIFTRYDTVYFRDCTDGPAAQNRRAKKNRKQAFSEEGVNRANGQTTRDRVKRDNALGLFRQVLEEKAARSEVKKQVVVVAERNTTTTCCHCGELEELSDQRGLSERDWTCPKCGFHQHRDRASAWNTLRVGVRQAGGQPVTEGRVIPLVADSARAGHGSAAGIERTSVSSHAGAVPREARVQAKRGVTYGDSSNVRIRGPARKRAGPQPLAEGTVSSSKDGT